MKVKIDTKEKFHIFSISNQVLTANMTEELRQMCLQKMNEPIPNIILNLSEVTDMDEIMAEGLVNLQQEYYENDHSMVICGIQTQLEKKLDDLQLLEVMNVTPTESEAYDIVQMEEIERELMNDDEEI